MATQTAATVDDVLRLAAEGRRYELVEGELVEMTPTGSEHGEVEATTGWVLTNYVRPRRLGKVLVGEALFQLDPAGRLARAADVAFIRRERLGGRPLPKGAFVGAPDLAVEVVSPGNSASEIQQKVVDWLSHGTLAVLLMYPDNQSVVLWRESGAIALRGDAEIDLDPALAGFRCKVGDLFPPPLEDDDPAG